jgi:hypothetical protein
MPHPIIPGTTPLAAAVEELRLFVLDLRNYVPGLRRVLTHCNACPLAEDIYVDEEEAHALLARIEAIVAALAVQVTPAPHTSNGAQQFGRRRTVQRAKRKENANGRTEE